MMKPETPVFTPSKVQSLATHLIRKRGGMGSVELTKLFYLIDLLFYKNFGRTLTGLDYIRAGKGPYTKEISNELAELEEYEVSWRSEPRPGGIPKKVHEAGRKPRFDPNLTTEEIAMAETVLRKTEGLPPLEIEALTYETEPMKEILVAEKKVGRELHGTKIDFHSVEPSFFLRTVIENNRRYRGRGAKDKEYEAFLRKEKKETSEVLQKL